MIRQGLKDIYFAFSRWAVLPNTRLARVRYRWRKDLCLHLGCGDDYRKGLINVDANLMRRKDLWLDLRILCPSPQTV